MTLEEVLNRTKTVAKEVSSKEAEVIDRDYSWVKKTMSAMQAEGLGGLVVPSEHGGLGYGLFALAKVCEILGAECGSSGLCFGMHSVGAAVISAKASPFQKETFLEPICSGKHITTLALSEPGTGAHFYFPQTELLKKDNESFIVNGAKTFITNGSFADSYVVSTVAAEGGSSSDQFSCVVIPKESKGLEWGKNWEGLGMRGNSSLSCKIDHVKIPANYVLGEKGDQLWYVFNVVAPYFLMAMAGTYLGIAQAALDEATSHVSKRTYSHSGRSLSDLPIIQHKLGSLWAKVQKTRSLIYEAAHQGDKAEMNSIPFILASKAEVAVTAVEAVNEAMTLLGGIGYRESSRVGRLLRDARAAHVMSPTTDILYTWIGRAILEQPILAD